MTYRVILTLVVASAIAWPALAQQTVPEQGAEADAPAVEQDAPVTGEAAREERLNALFERLADPEAEDWEQVQGQINSIWNQSGSPSMDLLARRADKAMNSEDWDAALLHLNDLVRLAPEFAEGWNKRATVYFLMGDYGNSLEDIAETLKREPRHFAALAGLGVILHRAGDPTGALEAYRRAIAIHPHLPGAADGIRELEKEVEGQRL